MIDRRSFIGIGALGAAGLGASFLGLSKRADAISSGAVSAGLRAFGWGELIPKASANTGELLLALPPGFEYNVFGVIGGAMADGNKTPGSHDGMAAFKAGKTIRLVRNHEVSNRSKPIPGSPIGAYPYDETAGGGTTTLIVDSKSRTLVKDFVSLSGTLINCAGGATPWGSWISCEETTLGPTIRKDGTGGFAKPHGYCFEVFASANGPLTPQPLKEMGRFVHEAIAVDRKSGVIYLTEDTAKSGFYRFIPKRNKRLAEGGELQMLAVKDKPNYDTGKGQRSGVWLETYWVKIDNPDPEEADTDPAAVFKQGAAKEAASFVRLEGCFAPKGGGAYFVSTSGGDATAGQIWQYQADGKDRGRLRLVFESPSTQVMDMPDNIWMQPGSNNLFICEDGDYSRPIGTPENYIRVLTPDGKLADFAKNVIPNSSKSEFAGATFSPDGKTLFVNIQGAGMTFAIWGDWGSFRN